MFEIEAQLSLAIRILIGWVKTSLTFEHGGNVQETLPLPLLRIEYDLEVANSLQIVADVRDTVFRALEVSLGQTTPGMLSQAVRESLPCCAINCTVAALQHSSPCKCVLLYGPNACPPWKPKEPEKGGMHV